MRRLHLYFQLHLPHQLRMSEPTEANSARQPDQSKPAGKISPSQPNISEPAASTQSSPPDAAALFDDATTFARANESEYQPFFALLERNSQKFPEFKLSLGVSGQWFEQAEKYDPKLIYRLKKLINLGHIQLITLPFDYSLSWFYDQDEFNAEVDLWQRKIGDYFGITGSIFAMPELIYNDKIASWADKAGYKGILIGEAEQRLDWRTPNRIYEAKGCRNLRLICQNTRLSQAVSYAKGPAINEDNQGKIVFNSIKFRRELDLEFLRGEVVSLTLDPSIFRRFREQEVIKFFDSLIVNWLSEPQNRFAKAIEIIEANQPKQEVSIKQTIMRENAHIDSAKSTALATNTSHQLPEGLNSSEQVKFSERLYSIREQVQQTKDEGIIRDFGRLTALNYVAGMAEAAEGSASSAGAAGIATSTEPSAPVGSDIITFPTPAELSKILKVFGQRVFSHMPKPAQITPKAGPSRTRPLEEISSKSEQADDFTIKVKRVQVEEKETKQTKQAESESEEPVLVPIDYLDEEPDEPEDSTSLAQDDTRPTDPEDSAGPEQDTPSAELSEDDILEKHSRIEIDLAELPEAEVVSDETASAETARAPETPKVTRGPKVAKTTESTRSPKTAKAPKSAKLPKRKSATAKKRTKHHRVVIE